MELRIRPATAADIPRIAATDPLASSGSARMRQIERAVTEGTAHVADRDGSIVGYVVVENASFFGRDFLSLLSVDPGFRRGRVGSALVEYCLSRCVSERLFTSTNQSNVAMQRLLRGLRFVHSGTIDDLDPGDPELFYSRDPAG
jgi:ribosomal protein S18 acetylase RimI-like enzyme